MGVGVDLFAPPAHSRAPTRNAREHPHGDRLYLQAPPLGAPLPQARPVRTREPSRTTAGWNALPAQVRQRAAGARPAPWERNTTRCRCTTPWLGWVAHSAS